MQLAVLLWVGSWQRSESINQQGTSQRNYPLPAELREKVGKMFFILYESFQYMIVIKCLSLFHRCPISQQVMSKSRGLRDNANAIHSRIIISCI